MTIIVTGGDGYLGWPTALRIADRTDERVIIVDNFARRGWVEEVGATSATPISWPEERLSATGEVYGLQNLSFIEGDLTDRSVVDQLLQVHEPSAVVHAAAQPSAPYSNLNGERANYTQHNNMQASRNLVFGLAENDMTDTHLIETTTTGVYGCYDDQTEILTRDGWKLFQNLTSDDTVLARDTDSREARYETPTDIQEYEFDGELYLQQNELVDFCITPNHRVFVQEMDAAASTQDRYDGLGERTVADIDGQHVIYDTGFSWSGKATETFSLPSVDGVDSVDIPIEDWLRFFGWYMIEGEVTRRTAGPNEYTVGLSQDKNSPWITDIEEALTGVADQLGIGVNRSDNNGVFRYELPNTQLATYLKTFAGSVDTPIPVQIKQLQTDVLEELLSTLIKANGRTQPGERESSQYFTPSERVADDVQEIAVKCGYAATVSHQPTYDRYVVSIAEETRVQANDAGTTDERIQYSGKVYCVTVPGDGIVYVRRNGKPVWSGNSPDFPIPEGGAVMENQDERDEVPYPAMAGSWYHQCYDDQTEILTRRGWERFEMLEPDDEVMAMDFETGETGWQVPSEHQEYDYSGEMVTVSGGQVDLKVTPNHRMLIGTDRGQDPAQTFENQRKMVQADELGERYDDPNLFRALPNWEGEHRQIRSYPPVLEGAENRMASDGGLVQQSQPRRLVPWLEFFGRWLATGAVGENDQNSIVRLYQSAGERIEQLFETIAGDSPQQGETESTEYLEVTDRRLASYLRRFASERQIPEWIRNLPRADLRILFDALMMGGGSQHQGESGWTFHASSATLADHVQEIALKLGHAAVINGLDTPDADTPGQTPEYELEITDRWCVQPNQQMNAFGREAYDGTVHCCTVDGGIVLVRRHGVPVWSGNSKSHDAANLRLAHKQFDIPISDVRTAIVYGTETEETRPDDRLKTRFDFDYYFGVVAHRFCAQAVAGYPLTVYGKGEQRKPFISLEDAVEGLTRLAVGEAERQPTDHIVYNQVTRPIAIVEMAETIQKVGREMGLDVDVTHVENPRDEDETHQMEIENQRYMDLIGGQSQTFAEGVRDILETLTRYEESITSHEDRFLPDMLTEETE
jgi:nucleoside-diphosphate-sugar epimerase/intein/homing endonuclease